jgi:plasmid maintenance system killer protein
MAAPPENRLEFFGDDLKPPYSIRGVERAIEKAHSEENAKAGRVYVIYSNGLITSQKGGELIWARTEFTAAVSVANDRDIVEMPVKRFNKGGSYAIVTEKDAYLLRDAMAVLYFGAKRPREPTDLERMLGTNLELTAQFPDKKELSEFLSKRVEEQVKRAKKDDEVSRVVSEQLDCCITQVTQALESEK